jgi:DNA-binding transcriptional MerR regulator
MNEIKKKYLSISEVSEILNIKEHVIRHWDSIDPKTNKFRIDNLSIRTKGGTRFFDKNHIKRLSKLKNILIQNDKRNFSLDLASKIISQDNKFKTSELKFSKSGNLSSNQISENVDKIRSIVNRLKILINFK